MGDMVRVAMINPKLVDLAGVVESSMADAVLTLVENSASYGREIRSGDVRAHQLFLEMERECIEGIVALVSPDVSSVAFLTGQIKIGLDLKRMGDEAKNIADRSTQLRNAPLLPKLRNLERMLELVQTMHSDVVEALVNQDAGEAKSLFLVHRQLLALKTETLQEMSREMEANPDLIQAGLQVALIARSLVRVGEYVTDMAVNIVHMFGERARQVSEAEQ